MYQRYRYNFLDYDLAHWQQEKKYNHTKHDTAANEIVYNRLKENIYINNIIEEYYYYQYAFIK